MYFHPFSKNICSDSTGFKQEEKITSPDVLTIGTSVDDTSVISVNKGTEKTERPRSIETSRTRKSLAAQSSYPESKLIEWSDYDEIEDSGNLDSKVYIDELSQSSFQYCYKAIKAMKKIKSEVNKYGLNLTIAMGAMQIDDWFEAEVRLSTIEGYLGMDIYEALLHKICKSLRYGKSDVSIMNLSFILGLKMEMIDEDGNLFELDNETDAGLESYRYLFGFYDDTFKPFNKPLERAAKHRQQRLEAWES